MSILPELIENLLTMPRSEIATDRGRPGGSVSALRILPAEVDAVAICPSLEPASGVLEVQPGAMDRIQHLAGPVEARVSAVFEGSGADVHSAMIAVDGAELRFELMMQVRHKVVSVYEEISRMQS